MTLREFIQTHDLRPELSFGQQWSASLRGVEIKDGCRLTMLAGYGPTARDALADLLYSMRGRRLIRDAGLPEYRHEFVCPETVELGDLQ